MSHAIRFVSIMLCLSLTSTIQAVFAQTAQPHSITSLPNQDQNFGFYDNVNGVDGPCNQAREIYKEAQDRIARYNADVEDFKKGRFCSDCHRSATAIEKQDRISFEAHIQKGEAHGRHETEATQRMYDSLYREFKADFDPMKTRYDQRMIECSSSSVKLKNERTEVTDRFNDKFQLATSNLGSLNQPQNIGDKNRYVTRLTQLKAQYTEEMNRGNAADPSKLNQIVSAVDELNGQIITSYNAVRKEAHNNSNGVQVNASKPLSTPNDQRSASYYTDQTGTGNDNSIQQSYNLTVAKLRAVAAGDIKAVNEINRLQQQQSNQQTQQLASEISTLLNASFERKWAADDAKRQAAHTAEVIRRAAQEQLDEQKKAATDALQQMIALDKVQLSKSKDPAQVLAYINNINVRSARVDTIESQNVSVDYQNKVANGAVKLDNALSTMIPFPQKIEPFIGPGVYRLDIVNKESTSYHVATIWKEYYNAAAYLYGDARQHIKVDTAKAISHLQMAEQLKASTFKKFMDRGKYDTNWTNTYYEDFDWVVNLNKGIIINAGFIGLGQMSASAALGYIYYDKAQKGQDAQYLSKTWRQYVSAINYYFDNNLDSAHTAYKNRQGYRFAAYTTSFSKVYTNLLFITNQFIVSGTNQLLADSAYSYCQQVYQRYFDPSYIIKEPGNSNNPPDIRAAGEHSLMANDYEKGSNGRQQNLNMALEEYQKANAIAKSYGDDIERLHIKIAARRQRDSIRYAPQNNPVPAGSQDAQFPGGNAALSRYIGSNLSVFLPISGDQMKGKVITSFFVEADDTVTVEKVAFIGNDLQKYERNIRDLFENMPVWTPAIMNGRRVRTVKKYACKPGMIF